MTAPGTSIPRDVQDPINEPSLSTRASAPPSSVQRARYLVSRGVQSSDFHRAARCLCLLTDDTARRVITKQSSNFTIASHKTPCCCGCLNSEETARQVSVNQGETKSGVWRHHAPVNFDRPPLLPSSPFVVVGCLCALGPVAFLMAYILWRYL